jgi:DegV family protein with EDD domain
MIHLITDSSCLYTPTEATKLGFTVNPLIVTIGGKSYHEFVEIESPEFLRLIQQGDFPTSSQPTIGEILNSVDEHKNDEIILLCMADGLSGTYQTACAAVQELDHAENIHVVNSKTLCGPHHYLVDLILNLIKENKSCSEILDIIQPKIDSSASFLMPQDFDYLKRGGRCTPLTATIGGLLKLQPVVQQTPDGRRLDKFATARSFDIAVKKIIASLEASTFKNPRFSVSHAFAEKQALKIKELLETKFPSSVVEIFALSCAFITQGGPYCIAIQAIEE